MSTIATAPAPTLDLTAQPLLVRRAAVLGAGTMGSRIAAHLANAGIPVLLLDLPSTARNATPQPTRQRRPRRPRQIQTRRLL